MAPSKNDDRKSRVERQRLRAYQARQTVHEHRRRRRVRDNWLAAVLVLVVAAGAAFAQVYYFSSGPGSPEATSTPTPSASPSLALPDPSLAEDRDWTGTLTLNDVPLGITLEGAAAPQGVSNFVYLAQEGFYDGVACHRLTTGDGFAVLQCGDPNGDGTGGPGYSWGPIENAPADDFYPAGTIAMARQSDNGESMGSQFFIVYEDTTIPSDSAGGYTVLGTVTSGLDELTSQITDAGTADGSTDGPPAVETTITGVTVQ